jgi:hypothetical protein
MPVTYRSHAIRILSSIAICVGILMAGSEWGGSSGVHAAAPRLQKVLIRTSKPYTRLVRTIEAMGGRVTHQYRFVNAIAAQVPPDGVFALRGMVGKNAITKDVMRARPSVVGSRFGLPARAGARVRSTGRLDLPALVHDSSHPNGYLANSLLISDMLPLFQLGFFGQGVKVAVIDTGIRPGFPHLEIDGSVIGGEDLSGDGDTVGFSDEANDGHGTYVAGMISANVNFGFDSTSSFAQAVTTYCPECADDDGTTTTVPMLGSAPEASIYAVKVFPATTSAVEESVILEGMERVLSLKLAYLLGVPETQNADGSYNALNIGVANLSAGGLTLYAGRDLEDQLTAFFAELDIVLTKSAGNAGPSGTTGGSPGTGAGGLTVGAAAVPFYERIFAELIFGPGFGLLYRPADHIQTGSFSARGPVTDGRSDPDVVANGDYSYGQGFGTPDSITLASGTSTSAPWVAGIAAVIRQAIPGASARDVEAALVQTANADIIEDGSGPLDRGTGYVDGTAAAAALLSSSASLKTKVPKPSASVSKNVNPLVDVVKAKSITRSTGPLKPGQRYELYYEIKKNTESVRVTLHDVVPGGVENQLFGDDLFVTIHSAKTHQDGPQEYLVYGFSSGNTWLFEDPEPGLMRITLSGDHTNASPIEAAVTIESGKEKLPKNTATGKLVEGQQAVVTVTVPPGVGRLSAVLRWNGDWSRYPTNDLDLIPSDPHGVPQSLDGATINAPERVDIMNPEAGNWMFLVDGFAIYDNAQEHWELAVVADGIRLKQVR